MRVHYNYIEQLGVVIPVNLIAGVVYPRASAALGVAVS
jgi:hypothetical protein